MGKNFYLLSDALETIEAGLKEDISPQQVADACHCSLSSLQKLFRYVCRISIADYISRRRLTCCAKELIGTGKSVLAIAMDYGYHSAEVFTRAFSRVWGQTPASFRKTRRFAGICPKFDTLELQNGGNGMTGIFRKRDISELYDYLNQRKGTYVIAFDIKHMTPINDISVKAGDQAILEAMRRIEAAAEEDMLPLRVGGDEFVLATGLRDEKAVDAIARKVTDRNGDTFRWEDKDIPLSLHAAKSLIGDSTLRYSALFPEIEQVIDKARNA